MRTKSKWYALLSIGLVLLLASLFIGCSPSTTLTEEQRVTHELYGYLMDYNIELAQAEQIWSDSLERLSEAVKAGDMTMRRFRQQVYEINLIYANTVRYIDSKPCYFILHIFMWDDGAPPDLAWPLPEFSYDDAIGEMRADEYIRAYIGLHVITIEAFLKFLKARADEQGVELTYTPKL